MDIRPLPTSLSFVPITLHTYVCCYSEDSIWRTVTVKFHSSLFQPSASQTQTVTRTVTQAEPLASDVSWSPPAHPFTAFLVSEPSYTELSPPCELTVSFSISLCHPQNKSPSLGWEGVRAWSSWQPQSSVLACNNHPAIRRAATVGKLTSARLSDPDKGECLTVFLVLECGGVPSSFCFLGFFN